MEDALKRLDKLTQEEARMAAAQILKTTHNIENKITQVIDGERRVLSLHMKHSKPMPRREESKGDGKGCQGHSATSSERR